jgi:class 3 adenylate cyclase
MLSPVSLAQAAAGCPLRLLLLPLPLSLQVANTYIVTCACVGSGPFGECKPACSMSLPAVAACGGCHEAALARFCLDALSLLDHGLPEGIGRVSARIGIHSGPLTAGIIGHSRRYFRVFGDTVNLASREWRRGDFFPPLSP